MNLKRPMMIAALVLCGCQLSCQKTHAPPALVSPALPSSAEAHLSKSADGQIVLSWLQREERSVSLMFSALKDNQKFPDIRVYRNQWRSIARAYETLGHRGF
ncbi:MAG: hypothetical protein AB8F65_15235 [Woeseiaceae bacterium]